MLSNPISTVLPLTSSPFPWDRRCPHPHAALWCSLVSLVSVDVRVQQVLQTLLDSQSIATHVLSLIHYMPFYVELHRIHERRNFLPTQHPKCNAIRNQSISLHSAKILTVSLRSALASDQTQLIAEQARHEASVKPRALGCRRKGR